MTSVQYRPVDSIEFKGLEEIEKCLVNSKIVLSENQRMITDNSKSFTFQSVVDRIYALRPCCLFWRDPDLLSHSCYFSTVKQLKCISDKGPIQQKSARDYIMECFTCCGCSAASREQIVLEDAELLEKSVRANQALNDPLVIQSFSQQISTF